MADFYSLEMIGVADGTQPPKLADGRVVDSKHRSIRASKGTVQALASGDRMYLGKLPVGATVASIIGNVSASLATSTLSIGTTAVPTKYVNAKTLTATDTPTPIGPSAASAALAPLAVEEDIWLTVGVATIIAGTVVEIHLEYKISA